MATDNPVRPAVRGYGAQIFCDHWRYGIGIPGSIEDAVIQRQMNDWSVLIPIKIRKRSGEVSTSIRELIDDRAQFGEPVEHLGRRASV